MNLYNREDSENKDNSEKKKTELLGKGKVIPGKVTGTESLDR